MVLITKINVRLNTKTAKPLGYVRRKTVFRRRFVLHAGRGMENGRPEARGATGCNWRRQRRAPARGRGGDRCFGTDARVQGNRGPRPIHALGPRAVVRRIDSLSRFATTGLPPCRAGPRATLPGKPRRCSATAAWRAVAHLLLSGLCMKSTLQLPSGRGVQPGAGFGSARRRKRRPPRTGSARAWVRT